jgi:hypothetical protein
LNNNLLSTKFKSKKNLKKQGHSQRALRVVVTGKEIKGKCTMIDFDIQVKEDV